MVILVFAQQFAFAFKHFVGEDDLEVPLTSI